MTLEEALALVERTKVVPPGKFAVREIDLTPSFRFFSTARLRGIHSGKTILCAWCNESPVQHKLIKYCSTECESSVKLSSDSKDAGLKAYLLIERQECKCANCLKSFEDAIIQRIAANHTLNESYHKMGTNKQRKVSYWQIGQLTGKLFQLDHIVPIFAGGHGTDLKNLQVLCVECHARKSVEEKQRHKELLYATAPTMGTPDDRNRARRKKG